jgi:phage tail-like protein
MASNERPGEYQVDSFEVFFGSKKVADVLTVSALKRTTEVVKHRSGGDKRITWKSPGKTEYDTITFERAVSKDNDFHDWANAAFDYSHGRSKTNFRKTIQLRVPDITGEGVLVYNIYGCWVSEYAALPKLNSRLKADDLVAYQYIKVECEYWELEPPKQ